MDWPRRRLVHLLDSGVMAGGVPPSDFSPSQIAGLGAWYRADSGSLVNYAANFVTANQEFLSVANNPSLRFGNIAWTVGGWFWLDGNTIQVLMAQSQTQSAMDWQVYFFPSSGELIANTYVSASYPQARIVMPSFGTWHFLVVSYDPAVGTGALSIQLNNGPINTNPNAGPMTDFTTGGITLGTNGYDAQGPYHLSGRMQHWFMFGRALDATERSFLWNGGNGRAYEDLSNTFKTGLRAWWPLDELSGTRRDLSGNNNTLTDNNTVTANTGKVSSQAGADGALIGSWKDGSTNTFDMTAFGNPTLQINELNGLPVIRFDGVDDFFQRTGVLGSALSGPQAQTVWVVQNQSAADTQSTTYNWDSTGGGTNILSTHLSYADNVLYYDTGNAVAATGRLRANQPEPWKGTWHIVEMVRDGTTNSSFTIEGNPISVYLAQPTGTFDGTVTGTFKIAEHAVPGAHIFQGDMAELLMYNRTLNATERTDVRKYLMTKWGIRQNKLLTLAGYGYLLVNSTTNGRLAVS